MKRLYKILGLGTLALTVTLATPLMQNSPVWANIQDTAGAIAQTLQREPQLKLTLAAEKQVIVQDDQGQTKETWQPLTGETNLVQPGDLLRYTLSGDNLGEAAAKNLVLTQPVPGQTAYVIGTAAVAEGQAAAITYSIDGGQTFVAEPLVEVVQPDGSIELEPAPAEAYTHVRWAFESAVGADDLLASSYLVRVK